MASKSATQLSSLLVVRKGHRQGRPCLRGTGIIVHNVAAAYMMGGTVAEMCESNPDLDPSLFHAALAYYFANKEQIEADLDRDERKSVSSPRGFPMGSLPKTSTSFSAPSLPR